MKCALAIYIQSPPTLSQGLGFMALGFTIVMRELNGVVWLSVGSMALRLNTASSDFFYVGSCKRLQNKIIYVLGGLEAYMPLRNTETQLRSFLKV